MYERYAKKRDELGLTDYKVAQMSGVMTSTLSEWKKHHETNGEQGYRPKIDKISSIAKALGISVAELISD